MREERGTVNLINRSSEERTRGSGVVRVRGDARQHRYARVTDRCVASEFQGVKDREHQQDRKEAGEMSLPPRR